MNSTPKSQNKKRLYLIDISSMFFRAFYAVRPLTAPSGLPTNAIYGVLTMVLKLLKDEKPDYLAFCHDQKEPSFRKEIYTEYKANRTEMPEDLAPQIPYIRKMADLLGLASCEQKGFEADDVIGTLAKAGVHNNVEVFIVSGDKDFCQVIEPGIFLYDTMKDIKLDKDGVKAKYNISSEQFIDYLAIVGDTSDNIPGVTGIGPKGAEKLINEFGSLDGIYANIDKIKSESVRKKLLDCKEQAYLSKKLVTIVTDVPLDRDYAHHFEYLKPQGYKRDELLAFLRELNFKAIEKQLFPEGVASQAKQIQSGTTATDQHLQSATVLKDDSALFTTASAVKSEMSNVDISNSNKDAKTILIKAKNFNESEFTEWLQKQNQLWILESERGLFFASTVKNNSKELNKGGGDSNSQFNYCELAQAQLSNEQLKKIFDQTKPDLFGFDLKKFLRELGCKSAKIKWDSQLASYAIRAGDVGDFKQVISTEIHQVLSDLYTAEELFEVHLKLKQDLEVKLKDHHAEDIFYKIDIPTAQVLLNMELLGFKIDIKELKSQSDSIHHDLEIIQKQIHKIAGETFNIASPKQLGHILFDKLKLPVIKKTKTGFSTDNEVLEKLSEQIKKETPHAPNIAKEIIEYRELAKLKSTYVDALPSLVDPRDGRVHSHFNQALTATGRLSSTNPNLQNIPIRTKRGAKVREAFIADDGNLLLSADYSQIELRILAHITDDPGLCKAFRDNLDIHAATASEVFGVSLKDVTDDLRRTAKAVNFGIAYGQGAFGLSEQLGISRSEASDIIKKYFIKFAKVQQYMETVVVQAKEKGYVETLFGRRRYIQELKSKNINIQKFGERAAINAPIQGTASDLVKMAMVELDQKCPQLDMILQVHDELIFEASEEKVRQNEKQVLQIMENIVKLKVPLRVNSSISKTW